MEKVFLNDKIVDAGEAHISVTDSGLLYGMGLFETMRCENGRVFAIDDHIERLFGSIKALAMLNTYDKEYIKDAIAKTIDASGLSDARLRLTLTNGALSSEGKVESTLLITATELVPYPAEYYKNGVRVILTDFRQNAADPTTGHKTTNYFDRMLALNIAHQKKVAETLWFTTDNYLAEGCVSNVFLVKDSVLYTPSLDTPVLPGIMRKRICEIAKKESIELVEKKLVISDLLGADEVFLSNVIMKVLPVIAVEAKTIGNGKVGPVTKRLMEGVNKIRSEEI